MKALKNCPFCDEDTALLTAKVWYTYNKKKEMYVSSRLQSYRVSCSSCLIETGWSFTKTDAIRSWNHREEPKDV